MTISARFLGWKPSLLELWHGGRSIASVQYISLSNAYWSFHIEDEISDRFSVLTHRVLVQKKQAKRSLKSSCAILLRNWTHFSRYALRNSLEVIIKNRQVIHWKTVSSMWCKSILKEKKCNCDYSVVRKTSWSKIVKYSMNFDMRDISMQVCVVQLWL